MDTHLGNNHQSPPTENNDCRRTMLAAIPDVVELVDADGILCDRKRVEQTLLQYQRIVNSTTDGLVLLNHNFVYLFANQTYLNWHQKTRDQVIGHHVSDILGPEFFAQTAKPRLERCLQGETVQCSVWFSYIHQPRYLDVTYVPFRDEADQIVGVLASLRDMTELKQAEQALTEREELFRSIYEQAGVGIALCTADGQILQANAKYCKLTGYTEAELQQITEQQITHPDDIHHEQQNMQACLAGEEKYCQLEKRYVCRDGLTIWVSVGKSVIRNPAGQVQQIMVTVDDITTRKRVADRTTASNRRLKEAMFEEATDAVFLVDANTRLTINCNSRAVELFEATSKLDLIGFEGNDLQVEQFSDAELTQIREEVSSAGFAVREVEYRTKQGNTFWGRLSVKLIQMVDSTLFLIQVSDISDRKQAELDMIRNMEELRRLNLSKDDFLSTVSHELRTPLTSIKMASKMLSLQLAQPKTNIDWQRVQSYLNILEEQCQQEDSLINDLLDLQRLKANTYTLNLRPISLQDWFPPILRGFADRTQQHQQQLRLTLPDNFPTITSDATPLRRIIVELLNNACKYTPAGEEIVIDLKLLPAAKKLSQQMFQLSICNSGIEIPAADQQHIFEPFYRAHKGDRWAKSGTGLGLALVQRLVNELHGTITCKSGSVAAVDRWVNSRHSEDSEHLPAAATNVNTNAVTDPAMSEPSADQSAERPAVKTCFILTFPLQIQADKLRFNNDMKSG